MQLANSSIDSICYYELTNYVCNNIISKFSYFVIHEIFIIYSITLLCTAIDSIPQTAKEAFVWLNKPLLLTYDAQKYLLNCFIV